MFDLIVKGHRRTPHRDTVPMLMSLGFHSAAAVALVVVPLLLVTNSIPDVPTMMAFVAAAPVPTPPPAPRAPGRSVQPRPAPTGFAAPQEAPTGILPEEPSTDDGEDGVAGGVEGGVSTGGVVADIANTVPPPPPSPLPPVVEGPVRIGGEIKRPALISRVEPEYPLLAVRAHVEGLVILEAVVDREGRVEDLRILRSMPLLNAAAMDAVRQWRYEPLLLNGKPERFILTVTVAFHLTQDTSSGS